MRTQKFYPALEHFIIFISDIVALLRHYSLVQHHGSTACGPRRRRTRGWLRPRGSYGKFPRGPAGAAPEGHFRAGERENAHGHMHGHMGPRPPLRPAPGL